MSQDILQKLTDLYGQSPTEDYRDLAGPVLQEAAAEIMALRAWRDEVARELGCLPSQFPNGNQHVIQAARALRVERRR